MHLVCPRCDAPFTSHDIQCHACGYRWQVPCAGCGKPNIPAARFCGACGMPLSLESRLWKEVREFLTRPFGIRLRNMATGFAFGGLLAFFAFGTMGMSSPHHRLVEPDACPSKAARPNLHPSPFSGVAFEGLQGWRSRAGESTRAASLDDLMQVGRSLLDTLSPPDPDAEPSASAFRSAEQLRYLQGLCSGLATGKGTSLERSDLALFLYRMASDLLDASPGDEADPDFTDIPRHHYMTIPIRTLHSLGIDLAREETVFGSDDEITVAELGRVAAAFTRTAAQLSANAPAGTGASARTARGN